MYISHKRSCDYGHKKWSDVHQLEIQKPTIAKDVRVTVGDRSYLLSGRIALGLYPV